MTDAAFVIPGDISLPTGGYAYDRHVLRHLPEQGIAVRHAALPGSFPAPTAADLQETARILASLPVRSVLLVDGLAYGAMPAALIADIVQPIVALVHHPLCLESGLAPARAAELRALETAALAFARRVVVTSPLTARTLAADFAVPSERITIAEPGTEPAARSTGALGARLALLSVGSIVPRKGYDVLVDALAQVAHLDWSLTIVGAIDRSPPTLAALRHQIEDRGLTQRITLAGPLPTTALDRLYEACDLFVLASHYEGYGMVLAEAMARGLAIVTTTGGAAAETVPDGAALKVPAGDADALAAAIGQVLQQPLLRQSLSDAAWTAGQKLPRWTDTAQRIAAVLREIGA